MGFLFVAGACRSAPDSRSWLQVLQEESSHPPQAAQAQVRLDRLVPALSWFITTTQEPSSPAFVSLLGQTVAAYQFYYFLHPTRQRHALLLRCYHKLESCRQELSSTQSSQLSPLPADFAKLQQIVMAVAKRSDLASKNLDLWLATMEPNSQACQQFLQNIQHPWEVGGVIRLTPDSKIETVLVDDPKRAEYAQYLSEFKQNDFGNLLRLATAFLERLSFQKIGADAATQLYNKTAMNAAFGEFSKIYKLATTPQPWPPSVSQKIAKAKANLFALGLEQKLLRQTFFFDKTPYLLLPQICFFFHSHPYQPIPYYQKEPSGQDKEMSFRIGPMLVLDIQKEYVQLYLVVLGESTPIRRWRIR